MIKHVDELESKKSPPSHSLKLCPGSALAFCISDCPQGSSGCFLQPDWALRDTQRPQGYTGPRCPAWPSNGLLLWDDPKVGSTIGSSCSSAAALPVGTGGNHDAGGCSHLTSTRGNGLSRAVELLSHFKGLQRRNLWLINFLDISFTQVVN